MSKKQHKLFVSGSPDNFTYSMIKRKNLSRRRTGWDNSSAKFGGHLPVSLGFAADYRRVAAEPLVDDSTLSYFDKNSAASRSFRHKDWFLL